MYPDAYVEYLFHFHADRDWFECHELLEEYWKEHPADPKSKTWVALIQVAVSLYHHRRGNRAGALKMIAASLRNMNDSHLAELGIDYKAFRATVERRLEELSAEGAAPFSDLNIPLSDMELIRLCRSRCEERGFGWRQPSDPGNRYIMNKHTLRDRTDVIEARSREAERKRELNNKAQG
jgi:predicted metal-dependent hydrolase